MVEVEVEVGNGKLRTTGCVVPGKTFPNIHQPFIRVKMFAGAEGRFTSYYGSSSY